MVGFKRPKLSNFRSEITSSMIRFGFAIWIPVTMLTIIIGGKQLITYRRVFFNSISFACTYWLDSISATTSRKLKYLSDELSYSSQMQKQLWHLTNQSRLEYKNRINAWKRTKTTVFIYWIMKITNQSTIGIQWVLHSRSHRPTAVRCHILNIYIVSCQRSAKKKSSKIMAFLCSFSRCCTSHFSAHRSDETHTDGQISRSDPMYSQSRKMPLHFRIRWFFTFKPHGVSLWQPYCRVIL